MLNEPVYPIGVISDLLSVHPETVRVWEKHGVVHPKRRSGKRFYSDLDLKRLRFIKKLIDEGLNLPAIRYFLRLYPCWQSDGCPHCMHGSRDTQCSKQCWKEEGVYCQVSGTEDVCHDCELRTREDRQESATMGKDS